MNIRTDWAPTFCGASFDAFKTISDLCCYSTSDEIPLQQATQARTQRWSLICLRPCQHHGSPAIRSVSSNDVLCSLNHGFYLDLLPNSAQSRQWSTSLRESLCKSFAIPLLTPSLCCLLTNKNRSVITSPPLVFSSHHCLLLHCRSTTSSPA